MGKPRSLRGVLLLCSFFANPGKVLRTPRPRAPAAGSPRAGAWRLKLGTQTGRRAVASRSWHGCCGLVRKLLTENSKEKEKIVLPYPCFLSRDEQFLWPLLIYEPACLWASQTLDEKKERSVFVGIIVSFRPLDFRALLPTALAYSCTRNTPTCPHTCAHTHTFQKDRLGPGLTVLGQPLLKQELTCH